MSGTSGEAHPGKDIAASATPGPAAPLELESPSPAVEKPAEKSTTENLKVIGGLLALGSGLLVLLGIVVVAIFVLPGEQAGAAATGGITAIASMVSAYFGIKIGNDGAKEAQEATKAAIKGQQTEASKVQALALNIHPDQKDDVIESIAKLKGEPWPARPAGQKQIRSDPARRPR